MTDVAMWTGVLKLQDLTAKTAKFESTLKAVDDFERRISELESQARATLEDARLALDEAGLSRQGGLLIKAIKSHEQSAGAWLVIGGIVGVALVMAAVFSDPPPSPAHPWAQADNLAFLGRRVLVFSVFSFLMITSVRNYRSCRHNQVSLQQRLAALTVYEDFKRGSPDVAAQVLSRAAHAIFMPQPTGYGGSSGMETHLTEVIPKRE